MKKKKSKDKEYSLISVDIPKDLYFDILKVCLETRETIDEFVERALVNFLEEYKRNPKEIKKKIKELNKKYK